MRLSRRALNRATLERQLLLKPAEMPVLDAVAHLAGLQAQAPFPPYYALWCRLRGFQQEELSRLLLDRSVVRMVLMRGTVHLVPAADALAWRPLVQIVMDRALTAVNQHREPLSKVDHGAVAKTTAELLRERPHSSDQLGKALAERYPAAPAASLMFLARAVLPLVQIPPRGVWGKAGQPTYQVADHWLEGVAAPDPSPAALVRRYLAAFGPATVADVQTWAGVTKLAEVVERMDLRTYTDPDGRTLYDLPEATLPDEDTPVPPLLLGPFDQTILSYADRTRVVTDEHRKRVITVNGLVKGTLLIDGHVRGSWETSTARGAAKLVLTPFERLAKRDAAALEKAGRNLLAWAEPEKTHEVRLTSG
ncbi:winged helix DNA-binding domain-containing protein [Amycolatopsis benzoatilytica]|uniref:winged helix DNA-binding domain-containing protein n=1 Tax=Amycolatopsis benzoatilytica TaxID=346045 RepID=UPI000375B04A|nr:winged helix DNA-binding domain-containing protein [Amycolatopsis benzoatilytica]